MPRQTFQRQSEIAAVLRYLPWANWILHPVSACMLAICSPPFPITETRCQFLFSNIFLILRTENFPTSRGVCLFVFDLCSTYWVRPSCQAQTTRHWRLRRGRRGGPGPWQGFVGSCCRFPTSGWSERPPPPLLVLLIVCKKKFVLWESTTHMLFSLAFWFSPGQKGRRSICARVGHVFQAEWSFVCSNLPLLIGYSSELGLYGCVWNKNEHVDLWKIRLHATDILHHFMSTIQHNMYTFAGKNSFRTGK